MSVAEILGPFLSERPIVVFPALSRALGSLDLAALVQRIVDAQTLSGRGSAFIFDTELSVDTTIPVVALPGLRGQLRAMGVLYEEENDATGMTSARIDLSVVAALIVDELPVPRVSPEVPDRSLPSDSPPPLTPLTPSSPSNPKALTPLVCSPSGEEPPKREPRQRPTLVPEDFQPTDRTKEIVVGYPLIVAGDVPPEVPRFVNHHRAKGTKYVDWQAAFRTWMANASKWRVEAEPKISLKEGATVITGTKRMSADRRRELEYRAGRGDKEAKRELGR